MVEIAYERWKRKYRCVVDTGIIEHGFREIN